MDRIPWRNPDHYFARVNVVYEIDRPVGPSASMAIRQSLSLDRRRFVLALACTKWREGMVLGSLSRRNHWEFDLTHYHPRIFLC